MKKFLTGLALALSISTSTLCGGSNETIATLEGGSITAKDVEKNKGKFVSRNVDKSEAELHGDIGISQGTITVTRTDTSYTIHYVRVYRKVGNTWELFMHRTVQQENFK